MDDLCQILSASECAGIGGDWLAGQVTCDFNPCDSLRIVWPDGMGEYPTIQDAIGASVDGDAVILADGIYTGEGNHDISLLGRAITVMGESGDPTTCIVDCEGHDTGFEFDLGERHETILSDLTISNAAEHGAFCGSGQPTFINYVFLRCGTGVYNDPGQSDFERCIFQECTEPAVTLYGSLSNYRFMDCVFAGNQGGAVEVGYMCEGGFFDCLFLSNHREGDGGAVKLAGRSQAGFTNCVFGYNSASESGGAVYGGYESGPGMGNCTLYGNTAPLGSGINVEAGAGELRFTIVADGSGGAGVEVDEWSAGVSFYCCDIHGNEGGDWIGQIAGYYGIWGNISEDPELCYPPGGDYNLQETSPCAPFTPPNPGCDLIGAHPVGCNLAGVDPPSGSESSLFLMAGSQNPVGRGGPIAIAYGLPDATGDSRVALRIYDASGRLVRTLLEESQPAGQYLVHWDGTGETGAAAALGVYFCKLSARGERIAQRLVLLK